MLRHRHCIHRFSSLRIDAINGRPGLILILDEQRFLRAFSAVQEEPLLGLHGQGSHRAGLDIGGSETAFGGKVAIGFSGCCEEDASAIRLPAGASIRRGPGHQLAEARA